MSDALIKVLELNLRARGTVWDTSPELAFIYNEEGEWRLSVLDGLPAAMWQPHPAAGLKMMAENIAGFVSKFGEVRETASHLRPAEWRGTAFFAESWLVTQQKSSPDDEVDPVLEEMARARMISTHPARIESRCWWAALDDGTSAVVTEERLSGKVHSAVAASDSKEDFKGTIPDALALLVRTLAQA